MDPKERGIAEAAIRAFSRHGVKRTTMDDIAEEAGLVRQTLYLSFRSKNDLLRAAIRLYADKTLQAIEREFETLGSLSEKLDAYASHAVISPFQELRATPDLQDLAGGFNEVGRQEITAAHSRFFALLERALAPYASALANAKRSPGEVAEFLHLASHHLKYSARDESHLRTLIGTLNAAVLQMAHQHEPDADRNA